MARRQPGGTATPANLPVGELNNPGLFTTTDPLGAWSNITLRDLFAAASMSGQRGHPECGSTPEQMAATSYADADAMLKARGEA